jgi:hypothetical protein
MFLWLVTVMTVPFLNDAPLRCPVKHKHVADYISFFH